MVASPHPAPLGAPPANLLPSTKEVQVLREILDYLLRIYGLHVYVGANKVIVYSPSKAPAPEDVLLCIDPHAFDQSPGHQGFRLAIIRTTEVKRKEVERARLALRLALETVGLKEDKLTEDQPADENMAFYSFGAVTASPPPLPVPDDADPDPDEAALASEVP